VGTANGNAPAVHSEEVLGRLGSANGGRGLGCAGVVGAHGNNGRIQWGLGRPGSAGADADLAGDEWEVLRWPEISSMLLGRRQQGEEVAAAGVAVRRWSSSGLDSGVRRRRGARGVRRLDAKEMGKTKNRLGY